MTCLVVSLGAGKLVPSISHQARWPYEILGAGFALLGLAFVGYGLKRQRDIRSAVDSSDFEHPDDGILAAFTVAGIGLGLLLLLLVVIET